MSRLTGIVMQNRNAAFLTLVEITKKYQKTVQTVLPAQANPSSQNNQDTSLDSRNQEIVMLKQSIKQLQYKNKKLL